LKDFNLLLSISTIIIDAFHVFKSKSTPLLILANVFSKTNNEQLGDFMQSNLNSAMNQNFMIRLFI
jgi:hypothetical protein